MKNKLIQEQREKAIIESFAKTFNKIKRLDENYIDESKEEYFAAERNKDLTSPANNEYIYSIENNKPIFIYQVNDKGHKEPVPVTKDILIDIHRDYRENYPGSAANFAIERGIPVEYIGKILMAGRYFSPDYGAPKKEELDELNLKKGLATLGLAATMMGAPKDAAAQNQMQQQQGIEKSVSSASALGLPQDNRKAGKVVIDSYAKNPFTADMWSKKTRENLRFFKTIKKLVDYYNGGGQVDYSDIEELGAMAKQSPVVMDFLQR